VSPVDVGSRRKAALARRNGTTRNLAVSAYGRVTQTTFPSNLIETYVYDSAGNLTSKTDRKNQTIRYVVLRQNAIRAGNGES